MPAAEELKPDNLSSTLAATSGADESSVAKSDTSSGRAGNSDTSSVTATPTEVSKVASKDITTTPAVAESTVLVPQTAASEAIHQDPMGKPHNMRHRILHGDLGRWYDREPEAPITPKTPAPTSNVKLPENLASVVSPETSASAASPETPTPVVDNKLTPLQRLKKFLNRLKG